MTIAKVNGINISYKVEGQGEPLVMISGLGSNGYWKYQTPVFKRHYLVITFDNRGVGKSDKPPGLYTTKMMAEDTISLMDYLNIKKAHILGVSMGGMIAQEIAINYPERITKLILGCTYSCHDNESNGMTQDMVEAAKLPIRQAMGRLLDLAFSKRLFKIIFVPFWKIQCSFIGESQARGLEGQKQACIRHNTLERLSKICIPSLVIVGAKDKVIKPSSSEVIVNNVSKARLVKAENGSHTYFMEMSRLFNEEVLNFLKSS
jgi:pimeloyl-ACP methyl ester carboxylesterase